MLLVWYGVGTTNRKPPVAFVQTERKEDDAVFDVRVPLYRLLSIEIKNEDK